MALKVILKIKLLKYEMIYQNIEKKFEKMSLLPGFFFSQNTISITRMLDWASWDSAQWKLQKHWAYAKGSIPNNFWIGKL